MNEDELDALRVAVGRGAELWAGPGNVQLSPGRWRAFSGADAVDYNITCCHGEAGRDVVGEAIADVKASKVKGIVMLAGAAREATAPLEDASWRAIGTQPLMMRAIDDVSEDPAITDLVADDLPEVRDLIARTFGVPPEIAAVAMPDTSVTADGHFGVVLRDEGALVCCVAGVIVDGTFVGWSMATDTSQRRKGYGRRTVTGMLANVRAAGAQRTAHISSPDGERLYEACGYDTLEVWEMWSRPRWTFATA